MPAGRPSKLTDQLVADVAKHLRTGHYVETASALVGISKTSLYAWLKNGARHRDGTTPTAKLPAHDRRCVEFLNAVEEAQAHAEEADLLRLAALGRGGLTNVVETVKKAVDDQGVEKVVERTTRTETLAPNAQVLEWRLERRFREKWGRSIEVTGKDGGPLEVTTEERAERLADEAALFLAGAAAAGAAVDVDEG